jgi:N-acetylglucosaminyl-diphospho-decaprenol L-rhamnosyltransferase
MSSTVAIINWNSGIRLRACIESLLGTTKAEILVVDNASEDDSMERVQGFRNRVSFISNSMNRGFAAAINQAFETTETAYVLVLNPDVRVMAGAVGILEEFMNEHPKAGAAGGHVNDEYLPREFPTVGTLVWENLGLGKIVGGPRSARATARSLKKSSPLQSEKPMEVEQPAAAAIMIRRDAYESIGGFDERFYPAWYEDVDFCRRLKKEGWEIYFVPKAEFLHEGGYSAGALGAKKFAHAYYGNQMRYAQKHFGAVGNAAVRVSVAAGMIARMIGRPKQAAAYGKALAGVFRKS